jgi:hypothetical protein
MKKPLKLFIIPLVVGLIVAIIQFGLPYLFKESKELTYKISDPINYLDPEKTGKLDIKINGIASPYLFLNQFTIENTGQIPLKEIAVMLNFLTTDTLFRIYNYSFETQPKLEFGDIKTEIANRYAKFSFALINPGDKVHINILTNNIASSEVFSKSEGMKLKQAEEGKPRNEKASFLLTFFASILSTILAFFAIGKSISSFTSVKTFIDNLFTAKQTSNLKIISALYGKNDKYFDITDQLNKLISNNKLSINVTNNIAGDPNYGVGKELILVYSFGTEIFRIKRLENELLEIPAESNNNAT